MMTVVRRLANSKSTIRGGGPQVVVVTVVKYVFLFYLLKCDLSSREMSTGLAIVLNIYSIRNVWITSIYIVFIYLYS